MCMCSSMTEDDRRMLNKNNESPAKCRERRRRRIEMRRLSSISGTASIPPENPNRKENRIEGSDCVAERKRIRTAEATDPVPSLASAGEDTETLSSPAVVTDTLPVFGLMSVTGRSREMEDAVAVRTNFFRQEIYRRRPVHFFAVYDGHGGPHVATMCRERMHVFLEEELMRVWSTRDNESGGGSGLKEEEQQLRQGDEEEEEEGWRRAMRRCFEKMDEVALSTCSCGSATRQCGCHPVEVALAGSTAVVAVLSPDHIVVANCGDSRAVLCRGGRAIPLSLDHKPDRSDELARIEASGGRVIFVNGARVEGILAMSRALGDKYLKPIVTSEPEISFTKRDPEDECLILASDGLWDVLSSDLACKVACKCLRERNPAAAATKDLNAKPQIEDEQAGALYPSRSELAAALLTRLALARKSSDNISVIVVDLKRS